MRDDSRIAAIQTFLSHTPSNEGEMREIGNVICDTPDEMITDAVIEGFSMRIMMMRDVSYRDKDSYKKSFRAKRVHNLSQAKMSAIEPPMGRATENLLMAQRIHRGEAPKIPMHRQTPSKPEASENRKSWYRVMRHDACRTFWVKTTREHRDAIRAEALDPPHEILALLDKRCTRSSQAIKATMAVGYASLDIFDPKVFEDLGRRNSTNASVLCFFQPSKKISLLENRRW